LLLTKNTNQTTGNMKFSKIKKMGINAESFGIILDSLIKIYSNPYVAALREYTSNAWDSHMTCGQTLPIRVSLPSALSPVFVVEDFGEGMDRIKLGLYGEFGFSSKRKDNDNIGGYGLGSKVGLAFSSQYTVRSVKDGYMNTVVIGRDEDGNPQMGFINGPDFPEDITEEEAELIELAYPGEPTDLPNGVKITIPTMEYHKFNEALSRNFFLGFAPGSILIDGKEPTYSVFNEDQFTELEGGIGWRRKKDVQERVGGTALLHGVSYSINWNEIAGDLDYQIRTDFLNEIVVKLENSTVDLQRSRESLVYSKRTREVLRQKLQDLLSYATKQYASEIDSVATYQEAVQLRRKAISYGFRGDYTWKGQKIIVEMSNDAKNAQSFITFANINDSSVSLSGYQVNKQQETLSSIVNHRSEMLTSAQRISILVYGAADPADYKNRTYHIEANNAALHAHETARLHTPNPSIPGSGFPSNPTRYQYVFTSLSKHNIPSWFKRLFTKTISAKQFTDVVTVLRKANAAEAAKRRKENAEKKAKVGLTVRRMTINANGRSTFSEVSVEDLDKNHNHVLFHLGESEYSDKLYKTLSMRSHAYGSLHYLTSFLEYLSDNGLVTFLYATKSVNVKAYEGVVPNLTLASADGIKSLITDSAKALVKNKSEIQKRAILDRHDGVNYWATLMPKEQINDVLRPEMQEWLRAIRKNDGAEEKFLAQVSRMAASLGVDGKIAEITTTIDSPLGDYPLLREVTSYRPDFTAVVEYINAMDTINKRV
jgi:hypothetical protein